MAEACDSVLISLCWGGQCYPPAQPSCPRPGGLPRPGCCFLSAHPGEAFSPQGLCLTLTWGWCCWGRQIAAAEPLPGPQPWPSCRRFRNPGVCSSVGMPLSFASLRWGSGALGPRTYTQCWAAVRTLVFCPGRTPPSAPRHLAGWTCSPVPPAAVPSTVGPQGTSVAVDISPAVWCLGQHVSLALVHGAGVGGAP